jgi:hypothetical protein
MAPKTTETSTEIRVEKRNKSCAQGARLSPLRCLFSPPAQVRDPGEAVCSAGTEVPQRFGPGTGWGPRHGGRAGFGWFTP